MSFIYRRHTLRIQLRTVIQSLVRPHTLNAIISLREEYNTILSFQVNKQLNGIKQMQFKIGDKPQKLLAHQLRQIQASRAIHRVKSNLGTILTDPKEINTHFMEFYSKIIQNKWWPRYWCNIIPSQLNLPQLSPKAVATLDKEISREEIIRAIKESPNN